MKLILKVCLFSVLLGMSPVFAGEAEDIKALKAALAVNLPQAVGATIKPTPIKGIYEVLSGAQILYMTTDARFVLDGDLFDLKDRSNLTETTRGKIRKGELDKLGEKNMLVYKPEGKTKHTITVFTDIYCPYCQRLHNEMAQYMKEGVKVRYVFLPFKGQRSFDTSVSVWCAKDPNAALDKAKSGQNVAAKTCDNPIKQHQALASVLGIRGTPAIMFENGQLTPGYIPAAKVIKQMESLGL